MFRQTLRAFAKVNRFAGVRGYAEAAEKATGETLKLSLALPHQTLFKNKEVSQVNIPASTGDMGILANHVPILEQLKPGIVEVFETPSSSSKYFISGGFASVMPGSKMDILSIEAHPLEDFDASAVKAQLAEAQKNVESADEEVAAEAAIEVEVLEALSAALH
ncbi:delta subunit of the central stalk of mitochondrial F1F0 ATP synthase, atp16 [Brettanomyces nanus]|uniref:ATP synthase subunit delta, mitochondrial n=1 Tax=Eeniella nana TaxID=13502 RepID=A0A875S720_EENNA|nr:delta subunit of the central stalk of mitochondrial F1F0 ATP synthase, atp16 [Brettanomyces nanus]QPG76748.1 delta subunit of the central stalk of mitochondrial F1F0 ATP synthase, atp16 [Brettanomyces nanus]